jgi:hypothetical protein
MDENSVFLSAFYDITVVGLLVGVSCWGVAILRNVLCMSMSMVLLEELVLGE